MDKHTHQLGVTEAASSVQDDTEAGHTVMSPDATADQAWSNDEVFQPETVEHPETAETVVVRQPVTFQRRSWVTAVGVAAVILCGILGAGMWVIGVAFTAQPPVRHHRVLLSPAPTVTSIITATPTPTTVAVPSAAPSTSITASATPTEHFALPTPEVPAPSLRHPLGPGDPNRRDTDPDMLYFDELALFNVAVTDPERIKELGHWACNQMAAGNEFHNTRIGTANLMQLNGTADTYTSISIVNAAVDIYCPQFKGK